MDDERAEVVELADPPISGNPPSNLRHFVRKGERINRLLRAQRCEGDDHHRALKSDEGLTVCPTEISRLLKKANWLA